MSEVNHDYKCKCGKPAVRNIQSVIQEYEIDNDGDMELIETTPDDNVNDFLCEDCYKREYGGNIH